ncbi:MAG TPA: hypothetical protein VK747_20160 [Blastocatellia bacterium]|nr:hypothetical protein [Blastocatellia bacterium]
MVKKILILTTALASIAGGAGCSLRSVATSVPSRVFREVHGLRVRSCQMTPVSNDLRKYKAIEIHKLNNLMLDEIPAQSVEQLNFGIVKQITALDQFDHIAVIDGANESQQKPANQPGDEITDAVLQPTLVLEGYIDDFTAGIPKLRYIEQGNNHAILTVRIMLKDKLTARVLGQMNITVENTRITSNVERMMSKSAEEVARYVRRSATRLNETKEAFANVQK